VNLEAALTLLRVKSVSLLFSDFRNVCGIRLHGIISISHLTLQPILPVEQLQLTPRFAENSDLVVPKRLK
jgi:hypothetical protein